MAHKRSERYTVHLGARGRLVLPADVRKRLALNEGDQLLLTLSDDGSVSMVSFREQARKARGILRTAAQGRSLADELVDERRKEAANE